MSNPITDFLWNINSEVAKISTSGLSRVTEVLDAAEAELTKDLANWTLLGKGDERFTPHMYRQALAQIRGTLDHIKGETDDGMASALKHGGSIASKLATSHLIREVETFSAKFEHSVRPIPFEAASLIAQGNKLMWPKFENSAERYAGQVGDDIRKQLAIGLVRGETIDQLTERLAKLGGPKGYVYTRGRQGSPNAKAEVIAEGLFRRYRHWGERLAVTETVNAYNSVAMEGMAELEEHDPGYFRRWDAAIDGRTCKQCAYYDDLVVPLDTPFPGRLMHPPLHPRCRCAVVVWRKEWDESSYKDDLLKETIKGKNPKGVANIPHTIKLPEEPKKPGKKKQVPPKPVLKDTKPLQFKDLSPISSTKFDEWQKEYKEKLSKTEKDAIVEYGGSGYRDINNKLRGKTKPKGQAKDRIDNLVKELDSALQKTVSKEDMLVYRATKTNIVEKLKPGQILLDKAYMSTTSEKDVTSTFFGNKGCLFHIEIPKGAHIAPIPTGLSEHELLLPRNSKLEIISIEDKKYSRPDGSTYELDNGPKIVKCRLVND